MPVHRRAPKSFAAVLLAILLTSCGGDGITGPGNSIQAFIVGVGLANTSVQATFVEGQMPAGGGGPAAQVVLSGALIPGGSQTATVSSTEAFNQLIVAIQGRSGYYRLNLAASTTEAVIALFAAQAPPDDFFDLQIGAGSNGAIGSYGQLSITLLEVGTGEVQVNVSWNALSDVDLHVVDPNGEEIYWVNRTSASGGELDLDANAGCNINSPVVNAENITWEDAPRGTYTVRVDYWSSCNVAQTNYVVTVQVQGQQTRTFQGTFTGPGDNGGAGSGTTITSFTY